MRWFIFIVIKKETEIDMMRESMHGEKFRQV